MKNQFQHAKKLFDLLERFPEEQILDVCKGKAKLDIVYPKAAEPVINSNVDIVEVINKLDNFQLREDARSYLLNAEIQKSDLKTIAKHYSISLGSRDTNTQIISRIVESVVGSKLRFETLLNTNLNN